MTIENEILIAIRLMDDEAQRFTLATAQSQARLHPRPAARPHLALVGAQPGGGELLGVPRGLQNIKLAASRRSSKKI